jgi:hypothetical protein
MDQAQRVSQSVEVGFAPAAGGTRVTIEVRGSERPAGRRLRARSSSWCPGRPW